MMPEIRVSVTMTTFNQERFIGQAIASVLMQRTSFAFELIVGEDCSTDRTPEIVTDYATAHPETIRLMKRERNLGMMPNFCQTVAASRGEYIAFLEGDDYWTCSDKLQKQVDALDAHPHWSGCFHPSRVFFDDRNRKDYTCPRSHPGEAVAIADLIRSNPIPTCSMMYRRALLPQMPAWFDELAVGDWPLWILLAVRGPIGYLDEQLSATRFHSESHWGHKSLWYRTQRTLEMLQSVDRHLGDTYHPLFMDSIARRVRIAAEASAGDESQREAKACVASYLRRSQSQGGLPLLRRAFLLGALFAPKVFLLPSRLVRALRRRLWTVEAHSHEDP